MRRDINAYHVDLQAIASSSYDGDGFLSCGVDGDAAGNKLPPMEAHHPLGLLARPSDPGTDGNGGVVGGQACTGLRLAGENLDAVVALGDARVTPHLPQVGPGGLVLYEPAAGPTDLARVVLNGDGSHGIVIHVAAGGPTVTIEVEGGPSITIDPSFVQLGAPGGNTLALAVPLEAGFASLQTALAGAGIAWSPPTGFATTKTKAT